jgi:hypothetical protein
MLSCAACAIVAVRKLKLNSSSTVVLSTAHPAKFEEAVALALENFIPPLPAALAELYTLPTRKTMLPTSVLEVQNFIRAKVFPNRENETSASSKKSSQFTRFSILVGIGVVLLGTIVTLRSIRRK